MHRRWRHSCTPRMAATSPAPVHLRCCAPRSAAVQAPSLSELHPPQSAAAAAEAPPTVAGALLPQADPRGPPRLAVPPPALAATRAAAASRRRLLPAAPPSDARRPGRASAAPACCRGRTGSAPPRLPREHVPRCAVLRCASWPPSLHCLPRYPPRHAPPSRRLGRCQAGAALGWHCSSSRHRRSRLHMHRCLLRSLSCLPAQHGCPDGPSEASQTSQMLACAKHMRNRWHAQGLLLLSLLCGWCRSCCAGAGAAAATGNRSRHGTLQRQRPRPALQGPETVLQGPGRWSPRAAAAPTAAPWPEA